MTDLQDRKSTFLKLSTELAYLSNSQISALFENDATKVEGFGTNHTLTVAGLQTFVKRVPLTDLEYQQQFSTNNLYEMPPSYSYGLGSAGFGAFRELLTHIKTTNWVLGGEIETFPLLYHYRILPRLDVPQEVDMQRHERFVAYWNGNENIGRHTLDRHNASWDLVLFLEHIPYQFRTWLRDNIDQIEMAERELKNTIAFLGQRGIIHFDIHFGNVVTDGVRPYLTDFGLSLDSRFDLSDAERAFFKSHSQYDSGTLLLSFGWFLVSMLFRALPEPQKQTVMQQFGIDDETKFAERCIILLKNIERLHASGVMTLAQPYVDMLTKHRDAILMMLTFFADMQRNNRKDTPFDNDQLGRLLIAQGFFDGLPGGVR